MAVKLLVKGEIKYGHANEFLAAVEEFKRYRQEKGWVVPEVLHAMSGPMNTVLMVFTFPSVDALEAEEGASASDPQYANVAGAMEFREPSIASELYREG